MFPPETLPLKSSTFREIKLLLKGRLVYSSNYLVALLIAGVITAAKTVVGLVLWNVKRLKIIIKTKTAELLENQIIFL
jgi:hypothetical protein